MDYDLAKPSWHVHDGGTIKIYSGGKEAVEIRMTGDQLLRFAADCARAASLKLRKEVG